MDESGRLLGAELFDWDRGAEESTGVGLTNAAILWIELCDWGAEAASAVQQYWSTSSGTV